MSQSSMSSGMMSWIGIGLEDPKNMSRDLTLTGTCG